MKLIDMQKKEIGSVEINKDEIIIHTTAKRFDGIVKKYMDDDKQNLFILVNYCVDNNPRWRQTDRYTFTKQADSFVMSKYEDNIYRDQEN